MIPDIRFRIQKIDHDGFNGRDHHPTDEMVDELVIPVSMEATYVEADGGEMLLLPDAGDSDETRKDIYTAIDDRNDGGIVRLWRCMRANGQFVDLVDHEIVLVVDFEPEIRRVSRN